MTILPAVLLVCVSCKNYEKNDDTITDTAAVTSSDTTMLTTDTSATTMTDMSMTGTAAGAMSGTDHEFVTKAAAGGMAEVELGNLAQQKAASADVKAFAKMMVDDHTRANGELTQLASSKGHTPPATLDPEHQAVRDRLNALSGAEFDREYMKAMVEDHQKTVQLFQTQASSGTDPDLKSWAATTLPKLQQHLQEAQATQGKLQ